MSVFEPGMPRTGNAEAERNAHNDLDRILGRLVETQRMVIEISSELQEDVQDIDNGLHLKECNGILVKALRIDHMAYLIESAVMKLERHLDPHAFSESTAVKKTSADSNSGLALILTHARIALGCILNCTAHARKCCGFSTSTTEETEDPIPGTLGEVICLCSHMSIKIVEDMRELHSYMYPPSTGAEKNG